MAIKQDYKQKLDSIYVNNKLYLVCFWSWFCIKDQRQFMFALELELNTKQNPVKGRIDLLFINFQDKVYKFQGFLPLLGCRLLFGCEQPLPPPACLFNKNFFESLFFLGPPPSSPPTPPLHLLIFHFFWEKYEKELHCFIWRILTEICKQCFIFENHRKL